MAKKTQRQKVERGEAGKYAAVGREFLDAAGRARECEYWTAAGLLMVHAGIALGDAVCIHLGGVKSTSQNHQDAVYLLAEMAVNAKDVKSAKTHLERLLAEKNAIEYTAEALTREQVEAMAGHAERFRAWADRILAI